MVVSGAIANKERLLFESFGHKEGVFLEFLCRGGGGVDRWIGGLRCGVEIWGIFVLLGWGGCWMIGGMGRDGLERGRIVLKMLLEKSQIRNFGVVPHSRMLL